MGFTGIQFRFTIALVGIHRIWLLHTFLVPKAHVGKGSWHCSEDVGANGMFLWFTGYYVKLLGFLSGHALANPSRRARKGRPNHCLCLSLLMKKMTIMRLNRFLCRQSVLPSALVPLVTECQGYVFFLTLLKKIVLLVRYPLKRSPCRRFTIEIMNVWSCPWSSPRSS